MTKKINGDVPIFLKKIGTSPRFNFFVFIIALVFIWYLGSLLHIDYAYFEGIFKKIPIFYGAALFIPLYCVVTFFIWLSKDALRLVAALVFGAYLSTFVVYIAEIINAFILFHLSRRLGREFVEKSLKSKLGNLEQRLSKLNFFWLFMFRATPLVPFRFLDLACGLSNISFKRYFLAVVLGSPLRIFWVQFVLAGVGMAIFNNPDALAKFLVLYKPLFILSFVYIILIVIVAVKIKLKD